MNENANDSVPPTDPLAPSSPDETVGMGHGKVILLGEHTVVFGHPAVVAGLPIGVRARVRPGAGHLRAPAWNLAAHLGDGTPVTEAVGRIFALLGAEPDALDVELESDLPAGAGLGSSAAMAVAVARAVGARTGATETDLEVAVAASEAVFHGNPSGVDAAAALRGGIGVFRRDEGWRAAPVRQKLKLCIGLSGRSRRTADLVDGVAHLARRTPAARKVLDLLGEISLDGVQALAVGDIDSLGRLFDLAHGLLAGLRLSTPELEQLVQGARAVGAIGAKLTGAGGGGAVIALAPSHRNDVLTRWRSDGFSGLVAVLHPNQAEVAGDPGVGP
jgi:mevalonate kinase